MLILTKHFKGHEYKYAQGNYLPETSLYSINDESDIRERYWNIQKGDSVIDAGAGYGGYTLPALACGAHVDAFEPHPPTERDLMYNLDVNRDAGWLFSVHCVALGAKKEKDRILPEGLRPDEKEKRLVDVYPLDYFIFDYYAQPHPVTWIKIDTEGMELEILQGAEKTLKQYKPKLLIEAHNFIMPNADLDIMRYLRDLNVGYMSEQIFPWGDRNNRSIMFSKVS